MAKLEMIPPPIVLLHPHLKRRLHRAVDVVDNLTLSVCLVELDKVDILQIDLIYALGCQPTAIVQAILEVDAYDGVDIRRGGSEGVAKGAVNHLVQATLLAVAKHHTRVVGLVGDVVVDVVSVVVAPPCGVGEALEFGVVLYNLIVALAAHNAEYKGSSE